MTFNENVIDALPPTDDVAAIRRRVDGPATSPGSITIHDANGAARSLRPERVEVRRPGSRGRLTWQLVSDVAITWEQLALWGDPPVSNAARRRT